MFVFVALKIKIHQPFFITDPTDSFNYLLLFKTNFIRYFYKSGQVKSAVIHVS